MFGFGKWLLKHASDDIADLHRRLDVLESQLAEDRMTILETADLVSYRLDQRERKRSRQPVSTEPLPADSRYLGAAKRWGVHP